MVLRNLERRQSVLPGSTPPPSPARPRWIRGDGRRHTHTDNRRSWDLADRKIQRGIEAYHHLSTTDSEVRFEIESKKFHIQRSRHNLVQIGEVKGGRQFRFWVNLPVLKWICRCLEKTFESTTTWKQDLSVGHRVFSFSLELNYSGYFVRIHEVRSEGCCWINVPAGDYRKGFRFFHEILSDFCRDLERIGPMVECVCFLNRLSEPPEEQVTSPSCLLLEADLLRSGIQPLVTMCEANAAELKRRVAWQRNTSSRHIYCCNCDSQECLVRPEAKEARDKIADLPIGREANHSMLEADCSGHPLGGESLGASSPKVSCVSIRESQQRADSLGSHWGRDTSGVDVIFEENGLLFIKTVDYPKQANMEKADKDKKELEGKQGTPGVSGRIVTAQPGTPKTQMDTQALSSRWGAGTETPDGTLSIEGLNALKRFASTGLKHVLNTGRKYSLLLQNASAVKPRDPPKLQGSKLNVNATPFEPMISHIEATPFIDAEDDDARMLGLEEAGQLDKGKGLLVEELEDRVEEVLAADDMDIETHSIQDFKIGSGGKANKNKAKKKNKKRR